MARKRKPAADESVGDGVVFAGFGNGTTRLGAQPDESFFNTPYGVDEGEDASIPSNSMQRPFASDEMVSNVSSSVSSAENNLSTISEAAMNMNVANEVPASSGTDVSVYAIKQEPDTVAIASTAYDEDTLSDEIVRPREVRSAAIPVKIKSEVSSPLTAPYDDDTDVEDSATSEAKGGEEDDATTLNFQESQRRKREAAEQEEQGLSAPKKRRKGRASASSVPDGNPAAEAEAETVDIDSSGNENNNTLSSADGGNTGGEGATAQITRNAADGDSEGGGNENNNNTSSASSVLVGNPAAVADAEYETGEIVISGNENNNNPSCAEGGRKNPPGHGGEGATAQMTASTGTGPMFNFEITLPSPSPTENAQVLLQFREKFNEVVGKVKALSAYHESVVNAGVCSDEFYWDRIDRDLACLHDSLSEIWSRTFNFNGTGSAESSATLPEQDAATMKSVVSKYSALSVKLKALGEFHINDLGMALAYNEVIQFEGSSAASNMDTFTQAVTQVVQSRNSVMQVDSKKKLTISKQRKKRSKQADAKQAAATQQGHKRRRIVCPCCDEEMEPIFPAVGDGLGQTHRHLVRLNKIHKLDERTPEVWSTHSKTKFVYPTVTGTILRTAEQKMVDETLSSSFFDQAVFKLSLVPIIAFHNMYLSNHDLASATSAVNSIFGAYRGIFDPTSSVPDDSNNLTTRIQTGFFHSITTMARKADTKQKVQDACQNNVLTNFHYRDALLAHYEQDGANDEDTAKKHLRNAMKDWKARAFIAIERVLNGMEQNICSNDSDDYLELKCPTDGQDNVTTIAEYLKDRLYAEPKQDLPFTLNQTFQSQADQAVNDILKNTATTIHNHFKDGFLYYVECEGKHRQTMQDNSNA